MGSRDSRRPPRYPMSADSRVSQFTKTVADHLNGEAPHPPLSQIPISEGLRNTLAEKGLQDLSSVSVTPDAGGTSRLANESKRPMRQSKNRHSAASGFGRKRVSERVCEQGTNSSRSTPPISEVQGNRSSVGQKRIRVGIPLRSKPISSDRIVSAHPRTSSGPRSCREPNSGMSGGLGHENNAHNKQASDAAQQKANSRHQLHGFTSERKDADSRADDQLSRLKRRRTGEKGNASYMDGRDSTSPPFMRASQRALKPIKSQVVDGTSSDGNGKDTEDHRHDDAPTLVTFQGKVGQAGQLLRVSKSCEQKIRSLRETGDRCDHNLYKRTVKKAVRVAFQRALVLETACRMRKTERADIQPDQVARMTREADRQYKNIGTVLVPEHLKALKDMGIKSDNTTEFLDLVKWKAFHRLTMMRQGLSVSSREAADKAVRDSKISLRSAGSGSTVQIKRTDLQKLIETAGEFGNLLAVVDKISEHPYGEPAEAGKESLLPE